MGGKSSSQPAGNTTVTNNTTPWSGQQPFLTGGTTSGVGSVPPSPALPQGLNSPSGSTVPGTLPSAADLYQNYTPQYFPGSTVSPFTPLQSAGQAQEAAYGLTGGESSVPAANNALTNIENGYYLNSNPNLQATEQNILSTVVPGIESTFAAGNRTGPGAAFAAAQGAASGIAPTAYGQYEQGLTNMLQGAAFAPGIESSALTPAQATQDAGNQQQAQNQAQLTNQVNQWNFQQQLPYNQEATYQAMTAGNYGGTSTLTQPYYENSSANTLAGLLGGASLGSSILGPSGLGLTSSGVGSGLGAARRPGAHQIRPPRQGRSWRLRGRARDGRADRRVERALPGGRRLAQTRDGHGAAARGNSARRRPHQ